MSALVLPDIAYRESYIKAVRHYKKEGIPAYQKLDPDWLATHFEEYLQKLQLEAKGIDLPQDYVPHTEFWLVDGDQFIGRLDIRHELNDRLQKIGGHIGYDVRIDQRGKGYGTLILKLGLEKAKALGFENVLITCDVGNVPSNKVIQANGGKLDDVIDGKNRYWISI